MSDKPTDVNVNVQRPGMNQWQQIAAYGVGTVALVFLLPLIWNSLSSSQAFIQERLITTVEKNTEQSSKLTGKVDDLVEEQQELNQRLAPLVGELKKVATAVNEQVKQAESEKSQ